MVECKIKGTGCCVPPNVVKNYDLTKIVDTSDEWITSRTGIKERRISKGEDTSYLASMAAMEALNSSNLSPLDIDIIIVATTTQDNLIPSCGCMVQKNIGAKNAFAFDVFAACTGFIYALNIADKFIKSEAAENILVIGAEVLSRVIDWSDRSTCILMGDGAGACVLSRSTERGIISIYNGSDGAMGNALIIPGIKMSNPFYEYEKIEKSYLRMDGKEIFKFAVGVIEKSIIKIIEENNMDIEQIDYIVPHQANYRIIEFAAKKLNIPLSKFYMNLDKYGNTSAASIPIALDEMAKKGILKKDNKIIAVGFGGGLTYGAALINW